MTNDNAPAHRSHRAMREHLSGLQARREAVRAHTATYTPNTVQAPTAAPTTPPTEGGE